MTEFLAFMFLLSLAILYGSLVWSVLSDAIRNFRWGDYFDAIVGFAFAVVLISFPLLLISAPSLVSH